MSVVNTPALNPVPHAVTHDPMGRNLTDEQRIRLREQLDVPVEEANKDERVEEKRDDDEQQRERQQRQRRQRDPDDNSPGGLIDITA